MKKSPTILDTTLRDGSYAINFQFTASDTATIAKHLEMAGIELIEIGHGVGLNATASGYGAAAESDEDYIKAAADVLTTARFGMFCIPGIARPADIDMAARHGMNFIRIGTDVTRAAEAEPFIAKAKSHGMFVSSNFMKSYVMPPPEFAETAKLAKSFGADVLCVVDSAGSMLRDEIEQYFRAVQHVTDIPLAFHGHNNLGLAVAHSLHAVQLGASIVDCSLQGMGRSAGNAATELLLAALQRQGKCLDLDLLRIMDIGEEHVKPFITQRGLGSLDITAGYAGFHTSNMGTIRRYCSSYQIDPRKLIIELCKHDRVNAPEDLVERLARELADDRSHSVPNDQFALDRYFGDEQRERS